MAFFTENTVDKLILPGNSCLLNFSVLNEYYSATPFRSFSIKYVVDGIEEYSVNGNKYLVKNNEYILANKHSEGYVKVDSKQSVSGICIDVAPDMLSEVVASYLQPDVSVADIELDNFFRSPDFLENKYAAQNTNLGIYLLQLEKYLIQNPAYDYKMDRDFYYGLAEKIVQDHIPVFKKFQLVKAIKSETKKDLIRKADKAKEYIDLFYSQNLDIACVALEAGLSEYHFSRLFKLIYGLSPYQYIIKLRLQSAYQLIKRESVSVYNAAITNGFADIQSFSKAFKKSFGFSPSKLQNSRI